jgi:hypothetical protein
MWQLKECDLRLGEIFFSVSSSSLVLVLVLDPESLRSEDEGSSPLSWTTASTSPGRLGGRYPEAVRHFWSHLMNMNPRLQFLLSMGRGGVFSLCAWIP